MTASELENLKTRFNLERKWLISKLGNPYFRLDRGDVCVVYRRFGAWKHFSELGGYSIPFSSQQEIFEDAERVYASRVSSNQNIEEDEPVEVQPTTFHRSVRAKEVPAEPVDACVDVLPSLEASAEDACMPVWAKQASPLVPAEPGLDVVAPPAAAPGVPACAEVPAEPQSVPVCLDVYDRDTAEYERALNGDKSSDWHRVLFGAVCEDTQSLKDVCRKANVGFSDALLLLRDSYDPEIVEIHIDKIQDVLYVTAKMRE